MSSIRLMQVSKHWGATKALDAIDLQIAEKTFCVLLGPSGCGKSTTLRLIAGLEQASGGQIFIDGREVGHLPPAERGISMVFQNYALFPHLSVADNICFGLAVRKLAPAETRRRLDQAAELLGLSALLARRPSQLSGGQQQRVALGRALVAQTAVCLMDEPLSNLDAQLRQEMRHELRELQRRLALTVVYVTHDQAEAMSMADQVVLLNQGRIEQDAPARTLYARPASRFAARFIGTPAMNLMALQAGQIAGLADAGQADAGHQAAAQRASAAWLGIRPENMRLAPADDQHAVDACVEAVEYLGADLVLRCRVGTETATVRADGRTQADPGARLRLTWPAQAEHLFDAEGRRLN